MILVFLVGLVVVIAMTALLFMAVSNAVLSDYIGFWHAVLILFLSGIVSGAGDLIHPIVGLGASLVVIAWMLTRWMGASWKEGFIIGSVFTVLTWLIWMGIGLLLLSVGGAEEA